MYIVKEKEDILSEDLLRKFIGRFIHVPFNEHNTIEGVTNLWFGGQVAGYGVTKLYYNFEEKDFTEEKSCTYDIVLTDGEGFLISNSCEIWFLSEEEFKEKLTDMAIERGDTGESN